MRRDVALAAIALSACGAEKAPQVVRAGDAAACKADTATLKAQEETAFAASGVYTDQSTPLHKVTAAGATYTITIVDGRCGTVGHTAGQTATDN